MYERVTRREGKGGGEGEDKKKTGNGLLTRCWTRYLLDFLRMSSRVGSRSERVKRNRSRDTRVVPREFSRGLRGELSSLWTAVCKKEQVAPGPGK